MALARFTSPADALAGLEHESPGGGMVRGRGAGWAGNSGRPGFRDRVLKFTEAEFVASAELASFDPVAPGRITCLPVRRISRRGSLPSLGFSGIHWHPDRPFATSSLSRLVPPDSERGTFMRRLAFLGINHATIFPGLDGIGRQLSRFHALGR